MKRLCLVYWVLAASAVLSEGQTNICFPEVCFYPSENESTNEAPNNLESQIVQARCNSACREDIILKQLNLTAANEVVLPTLPCWPSVHLLGDTEKEFNSACKIGCSFMLTGHVPTCAFCQHFQGKGNRTFEMCKLGCELGKQLRTESGAPPATPIAPPVPVSYNPVHFDFTTAQPNLSHCEANHQNTFVVVMSNETTNVSTVLESSADEMNPIKLFSCETVNVRFAVVNRYGASALSPAVTMCGGGKVYPSRVRNLTVTLEDDRGKKEQFGQYVVKILLSWEPPPEATFVSEYQVSVIPTSTSSHCPGRDNKNVFPILKDSIGITLESNRSAGFKFPVQCTFRITVESLPGIPKSLNISDWQQSARIDIDTSYLGQQNLQLIIMSTMTWNEAGFYTLQLNITLPDVSYVREGLLGIDITVHVSKRSTHTGELKLGQILPKEWIPISANQLTHMHTVAARYPPKEDDQEYVFDVTPKHRAQYYYYRMPQPKRLLFPAPSFPPSQVRNVTVISHVVKGNILQLNVSWLPPEVTNGELWRYSVYVWHLPTPQDKQSIAFEAENTNRFLSKEIFPGRPQYIMVRAENYFQAGNWSEAILLNIESQAGIAEGAIYGLAVVAALVAVVLVILIVLTVVYYWQRRRDKVVFLKDTETDWYVGGKDNATETLPVDSLPVDEWEISPEQIIMDKQLGSGNFGEVFLGKLIGSITTPGVGPYSTNRSAAVKLLRSEAGPELKMEFLKEISTMKKISMGRCPHVVNMIGCCTLQEPLALVLEYAAYGDLLEYLRTIRKRNCTLRKGKDYEDMKPAPYLTPVSEAEASIPPKARSNDYVEDFHTLKAVPDMKTMQDVTCKEEKEDLNPYARLGELEALDLISFAYQIAMGMEYLASIPIVHRDLACRNILVDENKVLKISDFGLARADELYVKNTDGKLPLRWMAVESIMERTFNHKSDVWSFGITLWEICTLGGHPYPSIGNKQLLQHILQGNRLEKPHNCSDDIYTIMHRCWAADPEERPTFAELRVTFDIMMSNQRTESYVDLNVDDLLPYYQMKPAEEEEEEDVDSPTLSLPQSSAWLPMDPPDDTVEHIPDNTSIDEPEF